MKLVFLATLSTLIAASMPAFAIPSGSDAPTSPSSVPDKCAEREVSMISGVAPAYPDSARKLNLGSLVVVVHLTVGANGAVETVSIIQSSNNRDVDFATLVAARKSTYAPAMRDCKPAKGSYNFRASFSPSA